MESILEYLNRNSRKTLDYTRPIKADFSLDDMKDYLTEQGFQFTTKYDSVLNSKPKGNGREALIGLVTKLMDPGEFAIQELNFSTYTEYLMHICLDNKFVTLMFNSEDQGIRLIYIYNRNDTSRPLMVSGASKEAISRLEKLLSNNV